VFKRAFILRPSLNAGLVLVAGLAAVGLVSTAGAQQPLLDPTRPLSIQASNRETAVAAHQLSSIIYSASRKLAIIDGQALREGELLPGTGMRVQKISANAVTLVDTATTSGTAGGGRRWTLELAPQIIKQHNP